jgi:uncharacterized protein (TIGR02444 family)
MDGHLNLWDFALTLYARPGVEAACMALQDDHDQNVPLLLWRLWALGRRVDATTLGSAVALARDWDERVVAALRTVRRRLTAPAPAIADAGRLSLRETVKASEIAAERLLLESLEMLTPKDETRGKTGIDALRELVAAWSRPAPLMLLSHLAAAAASVTGCRIADCGYGQ